MYVDKMKALVESLLADGQYIVISVIVTFLNDNWHFLPRTRSASGVK